MLDWTSAEPDLKINRTTCHFLFQSLQRVVGRWLQRITQSLPHHITVLALRGAVAVVELHALQGALAAHAAEAVGVEELVHGPHGWLGAGQKLATLPTHLWRQRERDMVGEWPKKTNLCEWMRLSKGDFCIGQCTQRWFETFTDTFFHCTTAGWVGFCQFTRLHWWLVETYELKKVKKPCSPRFGLVCHQTLNITLKSNLWDYRVRVTSFPYRTSCVLGLAMCWHAYL